jgi:predicted permease
VGRLRTGIGLEQAGERAGRLAEDLEEAGVTRHGLAVSSLREELLGETRSVIAVLTGAVALVLLVVSANLAHLSLARGWARGREIAVRGALGAGRGRLVRQLVTEALLLAALGGIGGIVLARAVTGWVALAADSFAVSELSHADGPRALAFAGLVALLIGGLFGLVSALRATAGDGSGGPAGGPAGGLAGGHARAPTRTRLRQGLVAAEIALSAVLLTGAGLLVRTVGQLLDEDVGFRAEGVLTAEIALPGSRYATPEDRARFWDALLERARALPGVEAAGLLSHIPLTGDTNGSFEIVGRDFPEGEGPHGKKRFAGPGTFEAMGIPVLRGRGFLQADRRDEPEVAVISRTLAERWWPGEDPLGRRIRFLWQTDGEQEIVGIVGDVRSDALDLAAEGTIYLAHAQVGPAGMALVLEAPGGPLALAEPLRRALVEIDPAQPLHDVMTLERVVRDSVGARLTVMRLLSAFALLALLLAAVAIYAVAAQSVSSRTKEIGVRLAVGADPARVVHALLAAELVPVVAGLAAGLVGSALAARALAGLLYRVAAGDPLTLILVTAVLGGAALLALALPARRVLRVDPALVLRGE